MERKKQAGADAGLRRLINAAIEARKQARTFNISVGIAFETYDGRVFSGFNVETYGHKGYHAEEVGLLKALSEGYNGTDFRRMVEIFQDTGHKAVEVFPACPTCWSVLNEFTHPYLEIIVADASGNVRHSVRLKDIFALKPPAQVFPSNLMRMTTPKQNISPKLPLAGELKRYCKKDAGFREYCEKVLKTKPE